MRKVLLASFVLLIVGAGAAAIYWRHIDAAMLRDHLDDDLDSCAFRGRISRWCSCW